MGKIETRNIEPSATRRKIRRKIGEQPIAWLVPAVVLLIMVIGLAGFAIAQSGAFLSLNSPASFLVDI